MRGPDRMTGALFSCVDFAQRVPEKHPLCIIKSIVDEALVALEGKSERLYEGTGCQSIAPQSPADACTERPCDSAVRASDCGELCSG